MRGAEKTVYDLIGNLNINIFGKTSMEYGLCLFITWNRYSIKKFSNKQCILCIMYMGFNVYMRLKSRTIYFYFYSQYNLVVF